MIPAKLKFIYIAVQVMLGKLMKLPIMTALQQGCWKLPSNRCAGSMFDSYWAGRKGPSCWSVKRSLSAPVFHRRHRSWSALAKPDAAREIAEELIALASA